MNILYVNSLEANNKELARQLASANVLIAEQNKLGKERQEWALHTSEVIRSLNQQLSAALAACKLKDESLEAAHNGLRWWMDTFPLHVTEADNEEMLKLVKALTIQPDDDALNAWLGEPVGEVKKHTGSLKDMAIIVWSGEQPAEGTKLYSTRHSDFERHAEDARRMLSTESKEKVE